VGLERDERGGRPLGEGEVFESPDDLEVTKVDTVVAPYSQRDRPDRLGRKSDMNFQLRTFSGTKVRRSGSV
jgi:hypothetical protein